MADLAHIELPSAKNRTSDYFLFSGIPWEIKVFKNLKTPLIGELLFGFQPSFLFTV